MLLISVLKIRSDLPIDRAASGSFLAPKRRTNTAARINRCQGLNSPIRMSFRAGCPSVRRSGAPAGLRRRSSLRRADLLQLAHHGVHALTGSRDVAAELPDLPPEPQRQQRE